ncbi:MAG: 6-hydroxynicotinate reductase [Gammaproteobacteria bacterium]|nr:6-hydroxynicotinate reductase [Gammaproteobacteria bacterium]
MTEPKASTVADRTTKFGAREESGIVRCDACPILCRIKPGKSGACDRYANRNGALIRTDPLVLTERAVASGDAVVPFVGESIAAWDGHPLDSNRTFITGIGSGTTYPDYKPAPFIVGASHDGVDTVTVVSEGIFSYCGAKVKIDTDRHLGAERALVRMQGEVVGHVTTAEYGSQMLAVGGVNQLTGGSRKAGRLTCETLLALCNREAVTLSIDDGAEVVVQAGRAPVVNGVEEQRMRVGCGSAAIGIFAQQWHGNVDEVIVVDDHITGVLTEHQAGVCLDMPPSGIKVQGRKSTPGRYFQVADPGTGWGGTNITDPLSLIRNIDTQIAWPGMRVLLTTTTGEDSLYCVLDAHGALRPEPLPEAVHEVVTRIGENCEPSICSVLFMAGAGGSLRAGVTTNPVRLTRSIQDLSTRVTMGGAPVWIWPGGGITVLVDVERLPQNAFGYVPTPAIVAPIEFTLKAADYEALGGHREHIVSLDDVITETGGDAELRGWNRENPWPWAPLPRS